MNNTIYLALMHENKSLKEELAHQDRIISGLLEFIKEHNVYSVWVKAMKVYKELCNNE